MKIKAGKWNTEGGEVAVVEYRTERPGASHPWHGYVGVNSAQWRDDGQGVYNGHTITTPYEEPRYRPWKASEVPVGAMIRRKGFAGRSLILGDGANGEVGIWFTSADSIVRVLYDVALEAYEWSRTGCEWYPCGIRIS